MQASSFFVLAFIAFQQREVVRGSHLASQAMSKNVVHTIATAPSRVTDLHMAVQRLAYLSQYDDSLRVKRAGDRVKVRARFFPPVQTGPGAHPASYTRGTRSFPWVKRPGCGVDHSPHIAPRLKKE
jgi:hypothetical protein